MEQAPHQTDQVEQDELVARRKQELEELVAKIRHLQRMLTGKVEEYNSIQSEISKTKGQLETLTQVEGEIARMEKLLAFSRAAVETISPMQLDEVSKYNNPPLRVKLVCEAVVFFLTNKRMEWEGIKTMMVGGDFIGNIMKFQPARANFKTVSQIEAVFLKNPEWNLDKIRKASQAIGPLAAWLVNQISYLNSLQKANVAQNKIIVLKSQAQSLEFREGETNRNIKTLERRIKRLQQRTDLLEDVLRERPTLPCSTLDTSFKDSDSVSEDSVKSEYDLIKDTKNPSLKSSGLLYRSDIKHSLRSSIVVMEIDDHLAKLNQIQKITGAGNWTFDEANIKESILARQAVEDLIAEEIEEDEEETNIFRKLSANRANTLIVSKAASMLVRPLDVLKRGSSLGQQLEKSPALRRASKDSQSIGEQLARKASSSSRQSQTHPFKRRSTSPFVAEPDLSPLKRRGTTEIDGAASRAVEEAQLEESSLLQASESERSRQTFEGLTSSSRIGAVGGLTQNLGFSGQKTADYSWKQFQAESNLSIGERGGQTAKGQVGGSEATIESHPFADEGLKVKEVLFESDPSLKLNLGVYNPPGGESCEGLKEAQRTALPAVAIKQNEAHHIMGRTKHELVWKEAEFWKTRVPKSSPLMSYSQPQSRLPSPGLAPQLGSRMMGTFQQPQPFSMSTGQGQQAGLVFHDQETVAGRNGLHFPHFANPSPVVQSSSQSPTRVGVQLNERLLIRPPGSLPGAIHQSPDNSSSQFLQFLSKGASIGGEAQTGRLVGRAQPYEFLRLEVDRSKSNPLTRPGERVFAYSPGLQQASPMKMLTVEHADHGAQLPGRSGLESRVATFGSPESRVLMSASIPLVHSKLSHAPTSVLHSSDNFVHRAMPKTFLAPYAIRFAEPSSPSATLPITSTSPRHKI